MARHRLLGPVATSVLLMALLASPTGAAESSGDGVAAGSITVYTSVTQDTVNAVLEALAEVHPDLSVDVFRAPTGELDARLATERRTGGIGADVLWLTDPLSILTYQDEGLLEPLERDAFGVVPDAFMGDTYVGTRLLNLVLVAGADVAPPTAWTDLLDPRYAGSVAMPDPGFAGSAFAALGYLGTADGFGLDFYQGLKENGAVIVPSPIDTLTGVAEGIYDVGITLDKIARDNIADGAPIQLVWPEPGAIALFSPVAVVAGSDDLGAASAFQAFLVSPEGQAAIASTGWQPVRDDVAWPFEGDIVSVDWAALDGQQGALLEAFYAIFGD